ncbi:hypothetical protein ABC733_22205 [Mangrovibacter sp. SLW1]
MRSAQGYANGGYVGKTDTSHLSSASSSGVSVYAPVTIEQSSSGASDVSSSGTMNTARQLQAIIQSTITDRLRKEMSPGGVLYKKTSILADRSELIVLLADKISAEVKSYDARKQAG